MAKTSMRKQREAVTVINAAVSCFNSGRYAITQLDRYRARAAKDFVAAAGDPDF
jgi:hypothetical protein